MGISNPAKLVEEFKKSGEFDRLRKELLAQFKNGESFAPTMSKVEEITRQRLTSDKKLHQMSPDAVHTELMGELDRFPFIERAASEFLNSSESTLAENIRESLRKILKTDREPASNTAAKSDQETPTTDSKRVISSAAAQAEGQRETKSATGSETTAISAPSGTVSEVNANTSTSVGAGQGKVVGGDSSAQENTGNIPEKPTQS